MPTTIEVNKQSVEALLGSGKSKPFVIPEYQRPYAWTDEQVETLFEDLWDFTATSGGTERESSYFLGSVVSYENEDGEQEIIDGQQRITVLTNVLRLCFCCYVQFIRSLLLRLHQRERQRPITLLERLSLLSGEPINLLERWISKISF